jgi:D-3-phosphoglycerate dehydrogenase
MILRHVGDANAKQVFKRVTTKADVLSLHIPWTPETNQMVDAAFVDAFTKSFWVFNTSRGCNLRQI